MLKVEVRDTRSWEAPDITGEDVLVRLSDAAITELGAFARENAALYDEADRLELSRQSLRGLRVLVTDLNALRHERLDAGVGVVIIDRLLPEGMVDLAEWTSECMEKDGQDTTAWSQHKAVLKVAVAAVSSLLGTTLSQGEEGRLVHVKEVKNRHVTYGQSAAGAERKHAVHYSDTAEGGDYHTDGAEIERLPNYLPFMCVRQAARGGDTLVKSIYPTHNRLLRTNPQALARLYGDFHWDRRGTKGPGGSQTFQKPVFRYEGGQLLFTYLRKYIEAGHEVMGSVLTAADLAALDALDRELEDESRYVRFHIAPGQLMISNNLMTIHGRPQAGFLDSETDARQKRLFLRTWVAAADDGGALAS